MEKQTPTPENENHASPGDQGKEESFLDLIKSLVVIILLVFAFKYSILDANNIPSPSMVPTLKVGDYLFVNRMRYSLRLGLRLPFVSFDWKLFDFDDPRRGDIVTFDPPPGAGSGGKTFVKRVIAIPGDQLRIERFCSQPKSKDGIEMLRIIINGVAVPLRVTEDREILNDLDDARAPFSHSFIEERGGIEHYVLYEGLTPCLEDNPKIKFADGEAGRSGNFHYCFSENGCQVPPGKYFAMGDNRDNSHDSRVWGFVDREKIYGKASIIYFSVDWKDKTCDIANYADLHKYRNYPSRPAFHNRQYFPPDRLADHCYTRQGMSPGEVSEPMLDSDAPESLSGWAKRMLTRRLWRADVRWGRIGKILE